MLSSEQVSFFQTFGYLLVREWFATEIADVTEHFERIWADRAAGPDGVAHDGTRRSICMPFIDRSEYLSALIDDPRIHDSAALLLGQDFNYVGCDGNLSVGDTDWHNDGREHLRFIRFFFYLDPIDGSSGALRVIPGSHLLGGFGDELVTRLYGHGNLSSLAQRQRRAREMSALTDDQRREYLAEALRVTERAFGVTGRDLPATVLAVQPGDVIITDHRILHASYGGGDRRRNFTISMSEHAPVDLLDDLRDWIRLHLRYSAPEPLVGGPMVATAGPERLRHLRQVLEMQDELLSSGRARD